MRQKNQPNRTKEHVVIQGNYNESFKCVVWGKKAQELMPCCQLVDEL